MASDLAREVSSIPGVSRWDHLLVDEDGTPYDRIGHTNRSRREVLTLEELQQRSVEIEVPIPQYQLKEN